MRPPRKYTILALFCLTATDLVAVPPDATTGQEKKTYLPSSADTKVTEVYWDKVERAAQYKFEIFDKDNKLILSTQVEDSHIALNLAPGTYQFKVAGVSKLGKHGPYTDLQSLTVASKGTTAEFEQRVAVISQIQNKIEESGDSAAMAGTRTGIFGKGNRQAGASFDYTMTAFDSNLSAYNNFIGGSAFFRADSLFSNVRPELRMGYIYSPGSAADQPRLGMFKAHFNIGYHASLLKGKLAVTPIVGGGLNVVSLSLNNFGNTYFVPGMSVGLEVLFSFNASLSIFLRPEWNYVFMPANSFTLVSPNLGMAYRF
jgi:hypothetical protein